MNSQSILWLIPLIFFQALSVVLYTRVGWRWAWGGIVQSLIIIGIALLGLGDLRHFPPATLPPYAPACALLGWVLMMARGVVPGILLRRFARNIMLLNPDAALADARLLRFFYWGAPGQFNFDIAEASRCYVAGDASKAEELLRKWDKQPLPRQGRESLATCRMSGHIITRDWDGIIKQYRDRRDSGRVPFTVACGASRAFAERGDIPQSLLCLQEAELPAARLSPETRNTSFLPFYSLAGAQEDLDRVLESLSGGRNGLPEYAKFYWKGRCLAARHHTAEARKVLTDALNAVPASLPVWKERINYQISNLNQYDSAEPKNWFTEISRAKGIQRRAELVADIVTPRTNFLAVFVLIAVMCVSFAVSSSATFIKSPQLVPITLFCWNWGVLDPQLVLSGQYWRLLTYLFLHAHISHLVLNVIGLWWFGRMSENLFGTSRFLAIYFVSGILSGITHSLLSPHMVAVGASGAIMGVFGATLAGIYRCKDLLPDSIRKTEVAFMVGIAMAQVVLDQVIPHVAAFAHLGGLVSGFLLGMMVPLEGLRRFEKQHPGSR